MIDQSDLALCEPSDRDVGSGTTLQGQSGARLG